MPWKSEKVGKVLGQWDMRTRRDQGLGKSNLFISFVFSLISDFDSFGSWYKLHTFLTAGTSCQQTFDASSRDLLQLMETVTSLL